MTFSKKFEVSSANTLNAEDIGKHEDGWTIEGEIIEDYYEWVNIFEASHQKFGKVWGNFEDEVFADSEEGYNDFIKNHPPHEWDYEDI